MKYDIAHSLEKRNSDNLFEIHFYFESDWWRAYEWSAYLAYHYNNPNVEPLNPTRKLWSKDEDGIILVGLKTNSFTKYFPDISADDLSVEKKEVMIKCNSIFDGIDISNYENILSEWKRTFDFKEKVEKKMQPVQETSLVISENRLFRFLKAQNKVMEGLTEINNIIIGSNS